MGGKEKTIQKKNLSYIEEMGKKEVEASDRNLFKLSEFGGIKEADTIINRYKFFTPLTKEDEDILRMNAPEPPSFSTISEKEYSNKFNCNKNRYKKKVKKYFAQRSEFYNKKAKKGQKKSKGQIYAEKRQEIEKKILQNAPYFSMDKADNLIMSEKLLREAQEKGYYPDIEELAQNEDKDITEVMEEQFRKLTTDKEYEEYERKIGKYEFSMHAHGSKHFRQGVTSWTGSYCQQNKAKMWDGHYSKEFIEVKKKMLERPLNRDIVVRRGQKNFKGLARALDLPDPGNATPDQIKEKLQRKIGEGEELILTEKAMMSTALPFAEKVYDAGVSGGGDYDDPKEIGIEYIILAKKGTAAANVIEGSNNKPESEVLISQNAKFRILKAELDGDSQIIYGNKYSWKIYMVTVPESENGIKYNEKESA